VQLAQLARYLEAARQRLERAGANLQRDQQQAGMIAGHWARYRAAAAQGAGDDELTRYRWLIEEWRVSLFAQALGTTEKVSSQRLDRLWQSITKRLAGGV